MRKAYHLGLHILERYDPDAKKHIAYLNDLNLIALGVVPYPRIVPSFFLNTYQLYSAFAPTDIDVLRKQVRVGTLEEKFPKEAQKVQSTNYVLGNHHFQSYLKSQRKEPTLLYSNASRALLDRTETLGLQYLSTPADASEDFKTKKSFREMLDRLSLPKAPHMYLEHTRVQNMDYDAFLAETFPEAVVQRAEKEVGGNEGTFFIHTEEAFNIFKEKTRNEEETSFMISPFINGDSVSMAGCVTSQGVLSGALQLQFIDVPESLHGTPKNGTFYGNDWGYKNWDQDIENSAVAVVEAIGNELRKNGFMGIFGVDFMIDEKTKKLYPLECNPRITGSMPAHSLMLLANDIPPFDYYHLLALAGKDTAFDFKKANESLKFTSSCSHISFSPIDINTMGLPLIAGVYSYDEIKHTLTYQRPGFHYADIENENEFIMIDAIPQKGAKVQQHVPGFYKFLFNHQIAEGTHTVNDRTAAIIDMFAKSLLKHQT